MGLNLKYEVEVEGTYFAGVGRDKKLGMFNTKFKIPESQNPLQIIQRKLINPWLLSIKGSVSGFRTCSVVSIKEIKTGKEPEAMTMSLNKMTKKDLTEYVALNQIPVNVAKFSKLSEAKMAILQYEEELQTAQENEKDIIAEQEADKALQEANNIDDTKMVVEDEEKPKNKQKANKAKAPQANKEETLDF